MRSNSRAAFYLWRKKGMAVLFFLLPLFCFSQTDILILQKNGQNIKTYAPGERIIFETIYEQWFDGTLTDLRNDSVFIDGVPFHYHEIKTMRIERTKLNYAQDGTLLIIAGAGVVALNVINGLYRNDKAKDWFSTTGWITSGALILGGILLKKARIRTFPLGGKYELNYLEIRSYKPDHHSSGNGH